MNTTRNALMMCLMVASAPHAGAAWAQESAAEESVQKAQEAMQEGQQAMQQAEKAMEKADEAMEQAGAMPEMSAQEQAMMEAWQKAATPGAEHQRLVDGMVGTWSTKSTMWMNPDAPPMVTSGTAVNSAVLGGRHVRMEYTGEMMGQQVEGVGYTGYDNVTGKYNASWMDNMSTGMFIATGSYDPETATYTYHGTMPDPMNPGSAIEIRETVRVIDADHHVMEWYEMHDGKERKTMQIEFTRTE